MDGVVVLRRGRGVESSFTFYVKTRAHITHTPSHTRTEHPAFLSARSKFAKAATAKAAGDQCDVAERRRAVDPISQCSPSPLLTTPINIANRKHMGDAPLPVVEQAPGVPMDAVSVHHTQTCGMQGGRVGRGMTRDVLANVALLACLIPSPPSLHTYTFSLCATCSVCRVREGGAQWWWWYCWRRRRRRRGRRRRKRRRRSELRDAR